MIATAQLHATTNGNQTENPYAFVKPLKNLKDDTMKERYSDIKKGNERLSTNKSVTEDDANIIENNESVFAGKYIQLENVISSDAQPTFSFGSQDEIASPLACEYNAEKNWTLDIKSDKSSLPGGKLFKRYCSHPGEGNDTQKHLEINQRWGSI